MAKTNKSTRKETETEKEREPSPVPEKRSTRARKQVNVKVVEQEDNSGDSDYSDGSVESVEVKPPPKKRQRQAKLKLPKTAAQKRSKEKNVQDTGTGGSGVVATFTSARETEENEYPLGERRVLERNVLKCLDLLQYGPRKDYGTNVKTVRNTLVNRSIKNLRAADYAGIFNRRITSLAWHAKYPYALASASKFGDILYILGTPNPSDPEESVKFVTKAETKGPGPGGSITAMKFHEHDLNILYRASIDCTVAKVNLERHQTFVYYNTDEYNQWFCSMDVNFCRNTIFAGDNRGLAYQLNLDGSMLNTWNLHKNKIHHLEFSKKDPNLLVSSSLDKQDAVRIWDIRSMRTKKGSKQLVPLHSLDHNAGLNCARFSPLDGSRLLTSDQLDEIRVYQGPLWTDYLTIKHHHKQFQHITPIKAEWHPVNDYVVIGRYPIRGDKTSARAIEFFDSYSGELVDAIFPPLDQVCSLNVFNPTGEYLATGMNSKLILWKPGVPKDVSENFQTKSNSNITLSSATRNLLRGRARQAREYSPVSGDDDEQDEDTSSKKKRSRTGNTTATKNPAAPAAARKKPAKKR